MLRKYLYIKTLYFATRRPTLRRGERRARGGRVGRNAGVGQNRLVIGRRICARVTRQILHLEEDYSWRRPRLAVPSGDRAFLVAAAAKYDSLSSIGLIALSPNCETDANSPRAVFTNSASPAA